MKVMDLGRIDFLFILHWQSCLPGGFWRGLDGPVLDQW